MAKTTKGIKDLAKRMDDSQKALERTRIAASAFKGSPAHKRPQNVQEAMDNAREMADLLNDTYSIERFHPTKVTIDQKRFDAMEKVISAAMVVANMTTGEATVAGIKVSGLARLEAAIKDLLIYDGDRSTVIASLLQMEEALSEDAAPEHSV